jgi:hypothetical protein
MNCAKNHNTALCRSGGHMWKSGYMGQTSGICASLVRNIDAMRMRVQCHMRVPSRHTIKRCCKVSMSPQTLQRSDPFNAILCSRNFVGTQSCSTLYYMDRNVVSIPRPSGLYRSASTTAPPRAPDII